MRLGAARSAGTAARSSASRRRLIFLMLTAPAAPRWPTEPPPAAARTMGPAADCHSQAHRGPRLSRRMGRHRWGDWMASTGASTCQWAAGAARPATALQPRRRRRERRARGPARGRGAPLAMASAGGLPLAAFEQRERGRLVLAVALHSGTFYHGSPIPGPTRASATRTAGVSSQRSTRDPYSKRLWDSSPRAGSPRSCSRPVLTSSSTPGRQRAPATGEAPATYHQSWGVVFVARWALGYRW